MNETERRRAFDDGIRRRDIRLCGSEGNSLEYWQERRRGEAARDALEAEARQSRGPYTYDEETGEEYGYFYGGAA